VVLKRGHNFLVRDLGSTNRTRLNGSIVAEAILKEGDQIAFGDVAVTFLA
jgi:pSer/pThr/pTyr-binding forkhead associated (FHA) protein